MKRSYPKVYRRYTEFDCALLRELGREHKDLLSTKSQAEDILQKKRRVWEFIATKYNDTEETTKATMPELRQKWHKILQNDKKRRQMQMMAQCNDSNEHVARLAIEDVNPNGTPSTPTVQLRDLALDIPAIRHVISNPITNVPQARHRIYVRSVRERKEVRTMRSSTSSTTGGFTKDSDSNCMEKDLLAQKLEYQKRKLEVLEKEHNLRMEILEIRKKQLAECNNVINDYTVI